jgi:hypothetical protein
MEATSSGRRSQSPLEATLLNNSHRDGLVEEKGGCRKKKEAIEYGKTKGVWISRSGRKRVYRWAMRLVCRSDASVFENHMRTSGGNHSSGVGRFLL